MIGQSAVLLPKSVMVGYGRHSETERVSVNCEGLAILSLLKIQSVPLGNLRELTTKPYNADELL